MALVVVELGSLGDEADTSTEGSRRLRGVGRQGEVKKLQKKKKCQAWKTTIRVEYAKEK